MNARVVLSCVLLLLVSGCASTRQVADEQYQAPSSDYRLIVMQPHISVAVLTAGGMLEVREDWTNQARGHVIAALQAHQRSRAERFTVATTHADAGADPQMLREMEQLHSAVGQAISLHKYSGVSLPTKKSKFDWTLGELAVNYGTASSYDYALFIHAQDSFSSGGRVALQAVSMLGCVVGVCVIPQGGMQAAFASLVDLKTGQVVWFNTLASSLGNIRTQRGATDMVEKLLATMELGKAPSKSARRRGA